MVYYDPNYFSNIELYVSGDDGEVTFKLDIIDYLPATTVAELEVTLQHVEVVYYDSEYFKDIELFLDGDDNQVFLNITIVKTLPEDTYVHYYIKGLTMGEYKNPVGIDYTFSGAEVFADQIMVGPFLHAMGLNDYPPQPGVYGVEGFVVDVGQLPENFYPNSYMTFTELLYKDKLILEVNTVSRVA